MLPRYSKQIVEYHINKLLQLGYSRNQIGQLVQLNIDKLLSDPGYFQSKSADLYKVIKLLHETDYHKDREIIETLELTKLPTLFNAYLLNSSNALELFAKICRFNNVSYPDNEFGVIEEEYSFLLYFKQHPTEASFSTSQGFLFYVIMMLAELLQRDDMVEAVGSCSGTFPDLTRFSQYVRASVQFNQPTSFIRINKKMALQPVSSYNPKIIAYLEQQFTRHFPEMAVPEEIKDLISNDILHAIHVGNYNRIFNVDYACIRYGLSRATLYRKLQEANTSFSDIVEQLRQSESHKLLTSSFLSLNEISERLGYSNLSAFNRAFKRWYGVSPAFYRNSISN